MKSILYLGVISMMSTGFVSASELINVDYGAHLNPVFSTKIGAAAIGSGSDIWNLYSRDGTSAFDWLVNSTLADLKYADGTSSGANLAVFNAPGAWFTDNSDPMFQSYLYSFDGGPIRSEISGLAPGLYDLYVYAHGLPPTENAILSLSVGSDSYGVRSTSTDPGWDGPGWTEGNEYVVFRGLDVDPGDLVTLISSPGEGWIPVLNGLQIVRAAVPEGPLGIAPAMAIGLVLLGRIGFARKTKI